MKRTPLKRKGGRRFPKQHDPKFWAWLGARRDEGWICDGCGKRRAVSRSHLEPRGRGGPDGGGNVALLCFECDRMSEKRVEAWIRETGVDLYVAARRHWKAYLNATTEAPF